MSWIKTKGLFRDEKSELMGQDIDDWADLYFKKGNVVSFNRASDNILTTIELVSGWRITIEIKFEEFEKLIGV